MNTTTTTTLDAFGPLRDSWIVTSPADCPDCLHAAYIYAIDAQDTGLTTFTFHHGVHTASATLA